MHLKKTAILLSFAALSACTKPNDEETKNNKIVLAENVQSNALVSLDSTWDENAWKSLYKYDNKLILNTIANGVRAGKLKVYSDLSQGDSELSIKEFDNLLVKWDSTATTEDPNNPGTFITAPIKYEMEPESIVQLRFNEKIEMDTVTYTLHKTVSSVTFIAYKYGENGDILGLKSLFEVKLNN